MSTETTTETTTETALWRVVDTPFTEERIVRCKGDESAAIAAYLAECCDGHNGVPYAFVVGVVGVVSADPEDTCGYGDEVVYHQTTCPSVFECYATESGVTLDADTAASAWASEWLEQMSIEPDSSVWAAVMPADVRGMLSLWLEYTHGEDRSLSEWLAYLGGDPTRVGGADVGVYCSTLTLVDGAALCTACRAEDDSAFWQKVGTERVSTTANYESVVQCAECCENIFGYYTDPATWLGHDNSGENVVAREENHGLALTWRSGEPMIEREGPLTPLTLEEARRSGLIE